ncbi:MAG TPA: transposase family protein [Bryobacteraceae bacterium]|nr:transposase family protein [Bryobacteraceae bacterium]
MTGNSKGRQLSLATRRELIEAIANRYQSGTRSEKKKILDEFIEVTGFHRKHAIRVLRRTKVEALKKVPRARLYDDAAVTALTILWEAADRICGKRLKEAIPTLVAAMERHGHLHLDTEVRPRLLAMSAATMDRLLKPVREVAKQGRRRTTINTALRKSIVVRTFSDWNDPPPGYFEMDMVAHCGKSVAGSHVHSLVLTDIASGWTEAASMVVREQTLVTLTVEEVRVRLPFPLLGLDVDNDSAFINETVVNYCKERCLELTRSRAYKKNDQAWIEQKNGAVVRRLVGYGRLEGAAAATALSNLHEIARVYVNFFQPSFKLKSKTREGAKVTKKYEKPATPYQRLLASERVTNECKEQLRRTFSALDPVQLLNQIREAQRVLAGLEVGGGGAVMAETDQELSRFVKSLSVAWQAGEVRPTHRKRFSGPRAWRTRLDPFEKVWPLVEQWLNEQPDITAKDLFCRLQVETLEPFTPGQLRTLQRRVKQWRTEIARKLVFGSGLESPGCAGTPFDQQEEEVTE